METLNNFPELALSENKPAKISFSKTDSLLSEEILQLENKNLQLRKIESDPSPITTNIQHLSNIHFSFKSTQEFKAGFDYADCQDWIKAGLQPEDHELAYYLKHEKKLTNQQVLKLEEIAELRQEFQKKTQAAQVKSAQQWYEAGGISLEKYENWQKIFSPQELYTWADWLRTCQHELVAYLRDKEKLTPTQISLKSQSDEKKDLNLLKISGVAISSNQKDKSKEER
ncbi:16036_t:CDS:2, partial [Racocetra fulgida]